MANVPTSPIGIMRKQPLELWLAREWTRRFAGQDPIPENLRRLAEKLAESQAEMGCANREVSAKTVE